MVRLVSVMSGPRDRGIRRSSNHSSLQPVRQRDQPEDSAGIRLPTNGSVAGHQDEFVGAASSPANAPQCDAARSDREYVRNLALPGIGRNCGSLSTGRTRCFGHTAE